MEKDFSTEEVNKIAVIVFLFGVIVGMLIKIIQGYHDKT